MWRSRVIKRLLQYTGVLILGATIAPYLHGVFLTAGLVSELSTTLTTLVTLSAAFVAWLVIGRAFEPRAESSASLSGGITHLTTVDVFSAAWQTAAAITFKSAEDYLYQRRSIEIEAVRQVLLQHLTELEEAHKREQAREYEAIKKDLMEKYTASAYGVGTSEQAFVPVPLEFGGVRTVSSWIDVHTNHVEAVN